MNPTFSSFTPPRQTFTRPPYHHGNPALWSQSNNFRPRPSTLPPPHPRFNPPVHPASTIPPSHPTSVKSEASAPIDFHNSPFPQQVQHSSMPGANNFTDFPTLFENPSVSLQQSQQYNDVTLDSLPSLGPEATSQVLNDSTLPASTISSNLPKLEEPLLSAGEVSIDVLFHQHCSIENEPDNKSLLKFLQDNQSPNDDIFQTANPTPIPVTPVVQNQVNPLVTTQPVMSPSMPPQPSSVPPQSMMSPDPLSPQASNPNMMSNAMSPHPNLMSPSSGVVSPQQAPNSVIAVGFSQSSPMTMQQSSFYPMAQGDPIEFGFSQQGLNLEEHNTNNSNNFQHGDGREDSLDRFLKKLTK